MSLAAIAERKGHAEVAAFLHAGQGWDDACLRELSKLLGVDVATAWTGGMLQTGLPADGTAADMRARRVGAGIVRVAGLPWTPSSHCLFPAAARMQAVSLLRDCALVVRRCDLLAGTEFEAHVVNALLAWLVCDA